MHQMRLIGALLFLDHFPMQHQLKIFD